MIKLPEKEDDIYVNALIHAHVSQRNREQAFDLDAYREICRIVTHEVERRLDEWFLNEDHEPYAISTIDRLFFQGWEEERGFAGPVNCLAAADFYRQAASLGHLEAQFRLAWLMENELIESQNDESTYRLYANAAGNGHVKSMIACGQHLLFLYFNDDVFRLCRTYFESANRLDPYQDNLYLGVLDNMLKAGQKNGIEIADNVEHILPLIGHLMNGESVHYQHGAESNIRLAKFLHKHHKVTGTFFLSWCLINGVTLPMNGELGMKLAFQTYRKHNAISNYYLAWVHFKSDSIYHKSTGVHFLKRAAIGSLSAAAEDLDRINQGKIFDGHGLAKFFGSDHESLKIEKWFGCLENRHTSKLICF